MSTCFRCPYTGEKHCDGPCGVCPAGTCVGEMDSHWEKDDEQDAAEEGVYTS